MKNLTALNLTTFALLYFEEVSPGRYDATNKVHRQTARAHYKKMVSKDKKAQQRALKKYIRMVREEVT